MKKPLVSVIIPIYNIEQYLSDAIQSVIGQSIGFSDAIEVLLIDDGSTDNSAVIAKEFADRYPENIRYIYQKNQGVSAARNIGLTQASGEFIHFFDGDDILSNNFYKESLNFLNSHTEVDFVAAKLKFFDEIIDSHPLNFKFKTTRVIDVSVEPNSPILHVISCVFKKSSIETIRFDERLSIAEDIKFISDVLLRKKKYGVIKTPTYHYRKRTNASSAIGGKEQNRGYYLAVPEFTYKHMLQSWSGGEKATIADFTILYDLAYRLAQKAQSLLDEKDEREYKETIRDIAARCTDEAIVTNSYLSVHQKYYVLRAKYGNEVDGYLETKQGVTSFKGYLLYNHTASSVFLDFLTQQEGSTYEVEGYINGLVGIPGVRYVAVASGEETELSFVPRVQREQSFLGDTYYDGGAFEATVIIPENSRLSFKIYTADKGTILPIHTGPFTRFGALKLTYRRDGNQLFKRTSHAIESYRYSNGRHVLLELRMLLQILLNWRLNTAKAQFDKLRGRNLTHLSTKGKVFEILKPGFFVAEAIYMIPRAFFLRTSYYIARNLKKRPIWIVSDRGMAAGDNGEALFRYIMSQDERPADVYFAISKKSKDYERVKAIGPLLKHGSLRHKLKHLLADKIISSQADIETTNPFIRQIDHYVGLFNFDFVFLQHGVIRHDLSTWLNRFEKNINIFVTSAQKEYNSILRNPYYYNSKNVLLSGLPRYDYLQNNPAKKLILAPTYRKNLAKQKTDKNGERRYDPTFKDTQYRIFYNNFMNDKRLLEALKNAGMTGEFYLHPVFSAQRQDFDENEQFTVMQFPYDYKTAFSEGEMLISDHSSVVFDFAYLKKPTAYAHFDVDTFFEGHTYDKSNFFSDEDDGFGGVYYDYDTLIEGVVQTIQKGCEMEGKYKKRVDAFFYKVDKNNSKRVYDAITNGIESV